ncbi:MAG TPA: hypothetical protein VIX41_03350, partial [Acidimicrobiales bacterium]
MALPLLGQLGGTALGGWLGRRAEKRALTRSPEERLALQGAQGAAGQLTRTGGELIGQGRELIAGPANYYNTLLRGNRAAMTQAVAPGLAQLTDLYRGHGRDLDRQGVRGAARDVAVTDLNRERASRMAALVTGVQPWAAGQLGSLGSDVLARGGPLLGAGADVYANLLGQGQENRQKAMEIGGAASERWTRLLSELGNAIGASVSKKWFPPPVPVDPGQGAVRGGGP